MKNFFAASLVAAAIVAGDARAFDYILSAGEPVRSGEGACWRTQTTLANEVLFEFDAHELRPEGRARLDTLARELAACSAQRIVVRAHADRIGADHYNRLLSARRAWAIRDHLVARGLAEERLVLLPRGSAEPVTGARCAGLEGATLVACLQPDRRVEIEVAAR